MPNVKEARKKEVQFPVISKLIFKKSNQLSKIQVKIHKIPMLIAIKKMPMVIIKKGKETNFKIGLTVVFKNPNKKPIIKKA